MLCQWVAPLGFIAVIAGWTTTEVGRQPWTVYGLLRTADSVSPSLTGANVALSLALYIIVYLIMFPTGIAFMLGLVRRGPQQQDVPRSTSKAGCRNGRSRTPRAPPKTPEAARMPWRSISCLYGPSFSALAVFYYVVFDGFDLGVGILYGFLPDAGSRNLAMNSIAPIWDGNETWLVFGGLGLLAAFPLAFAIIIPAVYFPILIMLLALVFRGVAFEFRFKRPGLRRFWDGAFCGGSILATFAQGTVLGVFIQGFKVNGRQFGGASFDWVSPFPLALGVALMFGYGLLGAGWLILKTEGDMQHWARQAGRVCLIAVLIAIVAVSVWTPLTHADIARRWFSWPEYCFSLAGADHDRADCLGEWYALEPSLRISCPFWGRSGCFSCRLSGSRSASGRSSCRTTIRSGRPPRLRARKPSS